MPGSKVYITYKRKLPSKRACIAHENGCRVPVSEGPSATPVPASDNYVAQNDPNASESQDDSALIFPGCLTCGVRGNLLECKYCSRSYHYQCVDKSIKSKHILNREKVTCGCKLQDISTLEPAQKSCRMVKCIEGSNVQAITVSSCKSSPVGRLEEGISEEGISGEGTTAPVDSSSKNKSHHDQVGSYSIVSVRSQGSLISQSMGIDNRDSGYFISSKSSVGRSCISAPDADSCSLKATNFEGTDSLSKDKSMDSPGYCLGKTKLTTPLITFSRRCKRRKENKEADAKSAFIEINCSSFAKSSTTVDGTVSLKLCVGDTSTSMDLLRNDSDSRQTLHHNQDNINNMDSASMLIGSALETKLLSCEEELSHGSESKSKNEYPKVGQGWISKVAKDAEEAPLENGLQVSLDDAAKDPCEAIVLDMELENTKCQDDSENLSHCGAKSTTVPEYTIEKTRPFLDLSATPDSCGTLDCNVNLNLCCRKDPVHTTPESLRASMDSTSRSYATVLDLEFPLEVMESVKKGVDEALPVCLTRTLSDASTSVEEAGSNLRDNEACPGYVGKTLESKCLQLFSEEIKGSFQPEVTKSMVSGSNNNQIGQISCGSLLDLGLYLPTESNMGNCTKNSSCQSPILNSDSKVRDFFQDAVHQSSSNPGTSLLRHKLMLESIVSRANALNTNGVFEDKIKSYTTLWSEEELDSLWIGVRRHGRDNWHTILKDMRLRFSSSRTARDLAEQWEEEQAKLLNDHYSEFKSPLTHDISLDHSGGFLCPRSRILGGNAIQETRLSLGDVYTHKIGSVKNKHHFKFAGVESDMEQLHTRTTYRRIAPFSDFHGGIYGKGSYGHLGCATVPISDPFLINNPFTSFASRSNLPHWLREAVNTPPRPTDATIPPVFLSISHSGTVLGTKPYANPSGFEFGGVRANGLQSAFSAHHSNVVSGMRPGKANVRKGPLGLVNKPDNLIVIDSDASSEETISDDHRVRL